MKKAKKTKRVKKTRKKQLMIMLGSTVLMLVAVYLGFAVYFGNHFLYGTTVNGIDASGKTIGKVEDLIVDEIKGYQLRIEPREGNEEIIQGKEIDLKPIFDGSLERELMKQNEFAWPMALFQKSKIEVDTIIDFNQKSLKKSVYDLKLMDKSKMREALDAVVSNYSEVDGYKIIPEEEGTVVEEDHFFDVLEKAILNLQDSISMSKEECYVKPKITQESEELIKLVETMNKYANASITYEFGENREVLNGKTISQWISVGNNLELNLSQEEVQNYVASLAETYNTVGKSKSLVSSYGATVTVSGGDYGWKIDQEGEVAALIENIKNGENISKEPIYAKTANSRGANDYGDTYVEVNLTAQHLYYYKNGSLILDTDFVSGNDAKGWSTPVGAYGLYYKQLDKTLRGEDYATPVSFWMPFNGGVGFHDATWRRDFGGNYYKKNGSHGCVNMPYDAAKKLYDNIEAGCAVLVYNLQGTESAKAKEQEEAERAQEEAERQAQESAAVVIQMIDSLGEITLASKDMVVNTRNQYNALSDRAKEYVTNYNVLEVAEATIGQLETEAFADQQAQAEAQPVIDAINQQLADREITLDMKETVEQVRAQYNQLSEAARSKVFNYNILIEAENIIQELENQANETNEPEEDNG